MECTYGQTDIIGNASTNKQTFYEMCLWANIHYIECDYGPKEHPNEWDYGLTNIQRNVSMEKINILRNTPTGKLTFYGMSLEANRKF